MATTRRQPALQIFQDPVTSTEPIDVAVYDPDLLDCAASATHVSDSHHTLLQPPDASANAVSPRKGRHPSSSPPPRALQEKGINSVALPPPQEQMFSTDAPVKRTQRPIPKQSQLMAANRGPMFHSFPPHVAQFDKENAAIDSFAVPASSVEALKPVLHKRRPSEAAPLRDRTKKPKAQPQRIPEQEGPLPQPHEMPLVEDDLDPTVKPPYSYAQLIGMAILRAPNRRLTLAHIYKWISDTFAFYRNQETGWQNSIRHNLSLSKSFSKQERPKDDPGKGHYWIINDGFEKQYLRTKPVRRQTNPDDFAPANPSDLVGPSSSSASFPAALGVIKSIDSSKFPDDPDLSSDATIPNSDPACHDGVEPSRNRVASRAIPSSPPPADIKSSPPPVARPPRDDTPPRAPAPRLPSNSRSGGRKRKLGFGDSGYYSSIESSAIKGQPPSFLTSEADNLGSYSLERGRAEDEIRRIRGSSYDSPTKTRTTFKQPTVMPPVSSPFRKKLDMGEAPFTPPFVFKRPQLPPPSASPNTSLRNHRDHVKKMLGGSPEKNVPVIGTSALDKYSWSPAMNNYNEGSFTPNTSLDDTFLSNIFFQDYQESPTKPSAKRPRLERAATTAGVLSSSGLASPSAFAPFLASPFHELPGFNFSPGRPTHASPAKAPTSNPALHADPLPQSSLGTHMALASEQVFGNNNTQIEDDVINYNHSDESEPGIEIDLFKGFAKIDPRVSVAANGSPTKVVRPGPQRSASNRF
ncbi:hypothetical protein M011DRAFT_396931 [Sporormia fimetaria CBS 119925]|uniref:Fork-head domain-containing protein n=1 Tax=Sporormia fimetaria CBS 119925 TaxID=1340428 RepID=A0A6A6VL82_9PLEO|nr:hypothetical protein M011DRAFT_396931 [Sporormia fimetaria CBS 119925]